MINPNHWNNKSQRFKNVAEFIPDKEIIIKRLDDLKAYIISEYNKSYLIGELVTKQWLDNKVNKFNNRPTHENDESVFFIPFIDKYIEDSKTRINPDTGLPINIRTIRKYNTTSTRLKEFETKHNIKLKHIDIGLDFFTNFVSFLSIDGKYSKTTINKYISQVKMFCNEIKIKGYNYNPEYESRRFYIKRGKTLDTYLNKDEINKIFELNIENQRQDKIRDLFIIGLWTGLRVSDFSEIERLKIVDNNILISSTVKTEAPVKIPIHPQIKRTLNKRSGNLPEFDLTPKSLENVFNKEIKVICKNAGIDEEIIGDLRNKETNRKERGIYLLTPTGDHEARKSLNHQEETQTPSEAPEEPPYTNVLALPPDEKDDVEPLPEPVEPEPLDTSDPAVKASLIESSSADEEIVNRMLVNEGLIQRFVVSVTNLANDEMAPNHQLLTPPEQNFRVYSQAGKQWIDAASYKRYTPYVDILESFDNEALLSVYDIYKADIQAKYAEIGDPDQNFDEVLVDAFDQLLDTPEVPVPVEVYTDSVAYKYADDRLENLSEPQKQLLRTGPDNMRRIKAKLRELKVMVEARGSD